MTREELKEWIDKEWAARQKEAWESYVDHQKERAVEMGKAYENGYFAGAAAEREACAKVCEETTASWTQHLYNEGVMDCVQAIRARGKE